MDPISLAISAVGLGVSLFGSHKQSQIAGQEAQVSNQMIGVEQQQNDLRQQVMNLSARRSQMEVLRNAQRARAMAVQAGANQGASYGSGLAGGLASVTDQAAYGLQGIGLQQQAGNQMFGYDRTISGYKQQLATLKGQEASAQGVSSLGGAIMKAGPMIGPLAQQAWSGGSNLFDFFSKSTSA